MAEVENSAAPPVASASYGRRQRVGLAAGLAAFVLLRVLPAPEGLEPAGWATAAVAVLMAAWWMTEALPIPATSLLPLLLCRSSALPRSRRRPRPIPIP